MPTAAANSVFVRDRGTIRAKDVCVDDAVLSVDVRTRRVCFSKVYYVERRDRPRDGDVCVIEHDAGGCELCVGAGAERAWRAWRGVA